MKEVPLTTPIKRPAGPEGEDRDIKKVFLKEPMGGDLRGLETVAILRMDYSAHRTLIPRICPQVTANDIDTMRPKALLELQTAVVELFV